MAWSVKGKEIVTDDQRVSISPFRSNYNIGVTLILFLKGT